MVAIFSDDFLRESLAFRGGTALHKLYLNPATRYSEDIDLVQIKEGPINPIMNRIGEVIDFFVEVELDPLTDKIIGKKVFKHGYCMDKYSGDLGFE